MANKFYNAKYKVLKSGDDLSYWHKNLLLAVSDCGLNLKGVDLMEIGCGNGVFLKYLQELGANVLGLEMSSEAAQICRKKGLEVIVGDFLDENFKTSKEYSYLVSCELIEHLYDPFLFLYKANNLLVEKGKLLLTCPNFSAWRWLIKYLIGGSPHDMQNLTHIRFFTIKWLKKILLQQGFEPIFLGCPVKRFNNCKRFLKYMRLFGIVQKLYNMWGRQIICIAEKRKPPKYKDLELPYLEFQKKFSKIN